jgi:hypothetical protein
VYIYTYISRIYSQTNARAIKKNEKAVRLGAEGAGGAGSLRGGSRSGGAGRMLGWSKVDTAAACVQRAWKIRQASLNRALTEP